MKNPSKFHKGQSPEYQLALLKKFAKMIERNQKRKPISYSERILKLNNKVPITNIEQFKLKKLIDYYAINNPIYLQSKLN